jgi:hypothetical protein
MIFGGSTTYFGFSALPLLVDPFPSKLAAEDVAVSGAETIFEGSAIIFGFMLS